MRMEPTRLVMKFSDGCQGWKEPAKHLPFRPALAVQPDIYQQVKARLRLYRSGGLIEYHLIGKEVLETDAGACLLPVTEDMGYAESSLLEPWGCVMAAYTQRRRLPPNRVG